MNPTYPRGYRDRRKVIPWYGGVLSPRVFHGRFWRTQTCGMTQSTISKELRDALGVFVFPSQVLAVSFPPSASSDAEQAVAGHSCHRFSSLEEFNDAMRPLLLPELMETAFNEGVALRELRADMERGDEVMVVLVEDFEVATQLAGRMHELGAHKCRYFGTFKMTKLHPEAI